jgi:hypothetical protein
VRVEFVKSKKLINEKDFVTFEYKIKKSVSSPHVKWLDANFSLYRQGSVRYGKLYRTMERAVVSGQSTFGSMSELAEEINRDSWYLQNYGDADWWKKNKELNNNENKILNPLGGR